MSWWDQLADPVRVGTVGHGSGATSVPDCRVFPMARRYSVRVGFLPTSADAAPGGRAGRLPDRIFVQRRCGRRRSISGHKEIKTSVGSMEGELRHVPAVCLCEGLHDTNCIRIKTNWVDPHPSTRPVSSLQATCTWVCGIFWSAQLTMQSATVQR
jgi:hypothetical protein